jgi:hypothetical protein
MPGVSSALKTSYVMDSLLSHLDTLIDTSVPLRPALKGTLRANPMAGLPDP